jgi:homoserine O-acetyltransferase
LGGVLPSVCLVYETWGRLSARRDNAILLHTGLSASSHARSHSGNTKEGWWEHCIGPGAALDTDEFFVICVNPIGGCYGSTGPSSPNPMTGSPYGPGFPLITIGDMVRAQLLLLDALGVEQVYASVGASLGGMQSLMHSALVPDRVRRLISISAALKSQPRAVALRFVQRQAVMNDPAWSEGHYYGKSFPHRGLGLARGIGMITYQSGEQWNTTFGRRRNPGESWLDADFLVESYLVHQGEKFCQIYDPNSYLYMSKAMDLFDLEPRSGGGVGPSVADIRSPALVVGVDSDMLFPVQQQRDLASALRQHDCAVTYRELETQHGHDTFLVEQRALGDLMRAHIEAS